MKAFSPWLKKAEERKVEGMKKPTSLVEACEILGDAKVGSVDSSVGPVNCISKLCSARTEKKCRCLI
jgi:hypothetical protein